MSGAKVLRVSTSHLSYDGSDRWDITLGTVSKTGQPCILAPDDWQMVMGAKKGRIAWVDYRAYFNGLLDRRQETAAGKATFQQIFERGRVVLCCACIDYTNCHRILSACYLHQIAPDYGYVVQGECEIGGTSPMPRDPGYTWRNLLAQWEAETKETYRQPSEGLNSST